LINKLFCLLVNVLCSKNLTPTLMKTVRRAVAGSWTIAADDQVIGAQL
jgi:hypothetical protein